MAHKWVEPDSMGLLCEMPPPPKMTLHMCILCEMITPQKWLLKGGDLQNNPLKISHLNRS